MASIIFETVVGSTAVIEFDATVSENHGRSAMVTQHAVEGGSTVTDHVRPDPLKLSLVGCVTNAPVNDTWRDRKHIGVGVIPFVPAPLVLNTERSKQLLYASVKGGYPKTLPGGFRVPFFSLGYVEAKTTPGLRQNVPVVVAGTTYESLYDVNRVKDVYEQLMALQAAAEPVTVVTDLQRYENMVISNIGAPVDGKDAILFDLEFTQIRFADAVVVGFVKTPKPVPAAKRNEKPVPAVAAPEAPPDEVAGPNSILKHGAAYARGQDLSDNTTTDLF